MHTVRQILKSLNISICWPKVNRTKCLLPRHSLAALLILTNSFVLVSYFTSCSSEWVNTVKSKHILQTPVSICAEFRWQNWHWESKKFDHILEDHRSLRWLNISEKILINDLVLVLKCSSGQHQVINLQPRLVSSTLRADSVGGTTRVLLWRGLKCCNHLPKDLNVQFRVLRT